MEPLKNVLWNASLNGDLEMVMGLHRYGLVWSPRLVVNGSIIGNHQELLEWALKMLHYRRREIAHAIDFALMNNHVKSADYLHRRFGVAPSFRAALIAIRGGNLDAVMWLIRNTQLLQRCRLEIATKKATLYARRWGGSYRRILLLLKMDNERFIPPYRIMSVSD